MSLPPTDQRRKKRRHADRARQRNANRHYFDQPIGWALCLLSVFLIFATLRGKHNAGPLLPQLVPIFGIPFAVVGLVVLLAFCFWQRSWANAAIVAGVFAVGFLLGSWRAAWNKDEAKGITPEMAAVFREHGVHRYDYDWNRHKWLAGFCLGGLGLGIKLLKENDSI